MKKLYIGTYGYQMNAADFEVMASVTKMADYDIYENENETGATFSNTCSIHENAESKTYNRLEALHIGRKRGRDLILGMLGCITERVRDGLVQSYHASLVCKPDSYPNLPDMIAQCENGANALDIEPSTTETYRDVIPQCTGGNRVSGFASIMRGCNNFRRYCIVPFTRGHERSRNAKNILKEVKDLYNKGFKEVTLLGQNINPYGLLPNSKRLRNGVSFAELLHKVVQSALSVRVRFTTSGPENMTEDTIEAVAVEPNLCGHIHSPAQSGSNSVLKVMNRECTHEDYLEKVVIIRRLVPDCGLIVDISIDYRNKSGEDFQQTLSLARKVGFDSAFMSKYSGRPSAHVVKHLPDNVPEEEEVRHLNELIRLRTEVSAGQNKKDEGEEFDALVGRFGKRSREQLMGHTPQNKAVIMPRSDHHIGETVRVRVTGSTSATLLGEEV